MNIYGIMIIILLGRLEKGERSRSFIMAGLS